MKLRGDKSSFLLSVPNPEREVGFSVSVQLVQQILVQPGHMNPAFTRSTIRNHQERERLRGTLNQDWQTKCELGSRSKTEHKFKSNDNIINKLDHSFAQCVLCRHGWRVKW